MQSIVVTLCHAYVTPAAQLDADKDGYLHVEELSRALADCNIAVGPDTLERLIEREGALDKQVPGFPFFLSFVCVLKGGARTHWSGFAAGWKPIRPSLVAPAPTRCVACHAALRRAVPCCA